MDDATILSRLQVIFDDLFQDSRPTVTMELSANDVDEWDSLMNVQLMVAAEQEFGISISAVDVENLQMVADLVRMIRAKLG
jgi:acyl carrier protein